MYMKSYLLNFFNLFLKNLLLHNMHCYNKKNIFKLQIQNILFKDRHSEEIHRYRDHFFHTKFVPRILLDSILVCHHICSLQTRILHI